MTAFKNDPSVPARLLALANGSDEKVRLIAIRSLGTFIDQDIAASLVKLTDPGKQPNRIIFAAKESLGYLTGLSPSTDWPAWWEQNKGNAPAQFAADLAPQRSIRFDTVDQSLDNLQDEFSRLLADLYQRTPREQQAELLVRHMRSPNASVRAAACRIATQAAANDVVAQMVKEQLRQLVGDASADVRRGAAHASEIINDPEGVVPLLVQLNQETDTGVRAARRRRRSGRRVTSGRFPPW
ncbi:MAG: HEAT repeat domain-containing protein [Tepidisphaeraceae bacterium]